MKKRRYLILGLLLYILLLSLLLQFDWLKILRPIPMGSVLLGMVLLTLCQYKKGMSLEDILLKARWNAFFAGLLASLLSLLSLISEARDLITMQMLLERLISLIFGSIVYLIINLFLVRHENKRGEDEAGFTQRQDVFCPETANPIFISKGFSNRECHVALKLLEGISNKEIASQLYISETTVKKHIQNMFKKCGATDRQDFISVYLQWIKESGK